MDPRYRDVVALRFLCGCQHHLMGNRICKQNQKIRIADLLTDQAIFLCKYFCLTAKAPANVRIADMTIRSLPPIITTLIHFLRILCLIDISLYLTIVMIL